jgi:hypothetical protein
MVVLESSGPRPPRARPAAPGNASMPADGLRAILRDNGISNARLARILNCTQRSARRYAQGARQLPHTAVVLLRLLDGGVCTVAQIEEACSPSPRDRDEPPDCPEGGTNDGGAVAAIARLTAESCRYPVGDPNSVAFHFCNAHRLQGHSNCKAHYAIVYRQDDPHGGTTRLNAERPVPRAAARAALPQRSGGAKASERKASERSGGAKASAEIAGRLVGAV